MKLKIFNGRTRFRQWDLNQKLICEGISPGTQIHFSSSNSENALVVESYELSGQTVANVPNILLQAAASLYVYVYIQESDEKYTVHRVIFGVDERPKPDDYVYTETEVLSYSELDKRIADLENNLEEEVIKAIKKAIENGDIDIGDITINIDDKLSLDSENPVQNKVVTKKINDINNYMYNLSDNVRKKSQTHTQSNFACMIGELFGAITNGVTTYYNVGDLFFLGDKNQPDFVIIGVGTLYDVDESIIKIDSEENIPTPKYGDKFLIGDAFTVAALEVGINPDDFVKKSDLDGYTLTLNALCEDVNECLDRIDGHDTSLGVQQTRLDEYGAAIGNFQAALDELHTYAQGLITGGDE